MDFVKKDQIFAIDSRINTNLRGYNAANHKRIKTIICCPTAT